MSEPFDPPPKRILSTVAHIISRRSKEKGRKTAKQKTDSPEQGRIKRKFKPAPSDKTFLTPQQCALFSYIIKTYLDGYEANLSENDIANSLSEEALAKHVFDIKPIEFRRQNPSNVRNGVTQIRQGLIGYYSEHPEEDVIISIPAVDDAHAGRVVGYIPEISWRLSASAHKTFEQAIAAREQRTRTSFARAIDLLKSIRKEHPDDAPTKARLAEIYALQIMHGVTPAKGAAEGGLEEARQLAGEALEKAKNLWAAHVAMGAVHLCSYRWEDASKSFVNALRIDEGQTRLQVWYFFFLVIEGKVRDAIQSFREFAGNENVHPNIRRNLALALLLHGDYPDAQNELEQLLLNGSTHFLFHIVLGMAYHASGKHALALEQLHIARSRSDSEHMTSGMWILIIAHSDRPRAERELKQLLARKHAGKPPYVAPSQLAIACIGIGDKAEAIKYLEEAYDSNDPMILLVRNWPVMRVLYDEPRFQALVERMEFPKNRV